MTYPTVKCINVSPKQDMTSSDEEHGCGDSDGNLKNKIFRHKHLIRLCIFTRHLYLYTPRSKMHSHVRCLAD